MRSSQHKLGDITIGIIIVLLVSMGQFNNTLFIPSLPHMSVPLGTSDSLLQLSVTLTLFAFGFSQLIYGPLSDYYGRKPIVTAGLIIFLFGNLVCYQALSGAVFLTGKVITGLGVGCVGPIARAIIRDLSGGKKLVKMMGVLVMFMSITPAISPLLGGAIQGYFGWRYNFLTLSVIAFIFTLFVYVRLPETNSHKHDVDNRLDFSSLIHNYRLVITHGEFLRMSLLNMLGYSAELVFLLSSSFILQDNFKLPPQQFGLIPLLIVPCVMVGNSLVAKLSSFLSVTMICAVGISFVFFGAVLMYSLSKLTVPGVFSFVIPMMIVALGEGIITPSSTARCMDLFGHKAGYAGAAIGAMAMIGAGIIIGLSTFNPLHSSSEVSIALLVISIILLVLCLINFKKNNMEITS